MSFCAADSLQWKRQMPSMQRSQSRQQRHVESVSAQRMERSRGVAHNNARSQRLAWLRATQRMETTYRPKRQLGGVQCKENIYSTKTRSSSNSASFSVGRDLPEA